MSQTLLIELFTEELPPKALPRLAASFAETISSELKKLGFAAADAAVVNYASPRRLAVTVANVTAIQPDRLVEKKGPTVAAGYKEGHPSPALLGFARSVGLGADQLNKLEKASDGKQDVFIYRAEKKGEPLAAHLAGIVTEALKKLPAPKLMRWSNRDSQFIRPVHGLVMLHGSDVVAGEVLGFQSGRVTGGHRFLSQGPVEIANADAYADTLRDKGKVMASFDVRRATIKQKLDEMAAKRACSYAGGDALIDEVTALVEWPIALEGSFDEAFLKIPQECLILTMQQNQKYFPLLDAQGKLTHHYLIVSNLETADPSHIINGNGRVLRARLSDAKFFYEQDQKHRLYSRVTRLANVVYHNKIGSQLERVQRLETIAATIAGLLGADTELAKRAAHLAKADLLTDMVGEFPELQGIMGTYYARLDDEDAAVAAAIEGHYHPRFAGDTLPESAIAQAVSLADKLETLVGIWGIGLIPTGDKDPFALRRAALGVLRMLVEARLPLDLKDLLAKTAATFPAGVVAANTVDGVFGFMLERLKHLLAADFPAADIEAVLFDTPSRFDELNLRLSAVAEFKALPEAAALAAANKRIRNILKKNVVEGTPLPAISVTLLVEAAERDLNGALTTLQAPVKAALAAHDYTSALKQLAGLRAPVDAFFDSVMVMAEDAAVRGNRLALLATLSELMNQVADISLLAD
ncbi:glycine--tRNA ligase subunit beta [Chitinimonas sp. BJB300]|uniref:glycine--tRNA ligase subunit beta n=1 Tax=Chitinimonas sp. BJB300 TaxID=1559339 RepID=UPI000C0F47E0|nr:glycine--tRNA ligase subunit beta [Chitinimonas sp. BJB300]PHV12786.1 glycine--tRNA ligase subunit beta [Chitinimonas sp. BJB300]TSJ91345.1 glycine--tRNA ligase subunit beta [Chitinimonas sp. BJB300]